MKKPAHNFIDLTGQPFGKLTVSHRVGNAKNRKAQWFCLCECGGSTVTQGTNLTNGNTKSCGCFNISSIKTRNTRHGFAVRGKLSKEYRTWTHMKGRCLNEKDVDYSLYGGRGITTCDRWLSFNNFYGDMGDSQKGTSLDRKDVNGNYSCGKCQQCIENGWTANCRWATSTEQARNTRRNHFLTFNNETFCVSEWAEKLGVARELIKDRLRRGWTIEKALTTPVKRTAKALYSDHK